jgi:hypothetical protein
MQVFSICNLYCVTILQIIPTCFNGPYFGEYSVTLSMFATDQFGVQVSMEIHSIVEVVSLNRVCSVLKGPVTGTVHDKDHIFSCLSYLTHFNFLLSVDWLLSLSALVFLHNNFFLWLGGQGVLKCGIIMCSHNIGWNNYAMPFFLLFVWNLQVRCQWKFMIFLWFVWDTILPMYEYN